MDLPLKLSEIRGVYGIYWNMRNRNLRAVGKGTYLVSLSLTPENTGKLANMRIKVGVK